MINEFYAKEAATPEEARTLATMYLRAVSQAFINVMNETCPLAKDNRFYGSDNSNPDNQLMTRKLIEQHGLNGVSIAVTDGPTYSLESKRIHPICYSYRDNSSSYKFELTNFVSCVFERPYTLKDKFGATPKDDVNGKLQEMAETMRKYFILKPYYPWSIDNMCTHLLDVYFLSNVESPLISVSGQSSTRFATGDVQIINEYKKVTNQTSNRLPRMTIDYYLDHELYNKMNLVETEHIEVGLPIGGDQTKNIVMWNALRALGQKWITDERMLDIKTLALGTLRDSILAKDFNKII